MLDDKFYLRMCYLYGKLKYIADNDLYTSNIGWTYESDNSLNTLFIFKTKLGPRMLKIDKDENGIIYVKYLVNFNQQHNSTIFSLKVEKDQIVTSTSILDDKIDLALYEIECMVEYALK